MKKTKAIALAVWMAVSAPELRPAEIRILRAAVLAALAAAGVDLGTR